MSTVLVPRKEARVATSEVGTSSGPPRERVAWHSSAPPRIAQADGWHDGTPGWFAWVKHLAARRRTTALLIWAGKRSPLAWALPADLAAGDTGELIASLHKPLRPAHGELLAGEVRAWLAETSGVPVGPAIALESLAWCHALARLAPMLPAETWWELLTRLVEAATAAEIVCGEDVVTPANAVDYQSWTQQLLSAELPLTLAWCFPELEACRRSSAGAWQRVEEAIGRIVDDMGLPPAAHLGVFASLLACWTRCGAVGQTLEEARWSATAQTRFRGAVRTALRLVRHDGSQAGAREDGARESTGTGRAKATVEMLTAAAELADDRGLQKLAAELLGRGAIDRKKPSKQRTKKAPPRMRKAGGPGAPPLAGIGSDHSQLSILRCDWRSGSPLLVVEHDVPGSDATKGLSIELSSGREVLLQGSIELELRLDGQALAPTGIWENICWESDEAVDYLELELALDRGVKVQRQLLLAREALLLLIADAVTIEGAATQPTASDPSPSAGQSPAAPAWEHRLRLPLAGDVSFEPADETREGWLHAGRRAAAVVPLALGEWKTDGRPGALSASHVAEFLRDSRSLAEDSRLGETRPRAEAGKGLELHAVARGRGFYAPLMIDLNPRRLRRAVTWRRLTVAENRHIQPLDAAAGFRLQIGREQWVLYRSLTGPANRTLLGINTYSEFLLGRFGRDGESKPILEIEPAED